MGISCGKADSSDGSRVQNGDTLISGNRNINHSRELCELHIKKGLDSMLPCDNERVTVKELLDSCGSVDGSEVKVTFPDCSPTNDFDDIDGPGEDIEQLSFRTNDVKWKRKRRREFIYTLPQDKYSTIHEESIKVNGDKIAICVLSDLHIGGSWALGMERKLEKYFETLYEIATEKVAVLVLLGDVFEMWLDKFCDIPPTNAQRVAHWKERGSHIMKYVQKLVDEHQVKVYLIRGNHDQEMTLSDTEELFGRKVTYIEGTLILRLLLTTNKEVRVRFAHGHEWDIFNSYLLCQENNLLHKRPIGHYIARAVATSGRGDNDSDLENMLISMAKALLSAIPADLEDDLVDILSEADYQMQLTRRLFTGALKVDNLDEVMGIKCRVALDKFIPLTTMVQYPYLKLSAAIVGQQDVFHMIKAAMGDYKKFIKRCDEDVVVLAHTHQWDLKRYKNFRGNIVTYANTGCWTNKSEEFSAVMLYPPTPESDGQILVNHG